MMREMFDQYRAAVKELEVLRHRLAGMRRLTDTVRGSSAEYPYTEHTITVEGRNAAEETALREEIRELEDKLRRVDEAIRRAPNSTIRMALRLRYQEGYRWRDVAAYMGRDVGEDAWRKMVDKYLDSLQS